MFGNNLLGVPAQFGLEPQWDILAGMGLLLVVVVSLALYLAKDVEGESINYIVAGRTLPIPIIAATLMAQAVDANMTLGNTDFAAHFGFWAGFVLPGGLALCLFVVALFFAKPLNRLDLLTIPDFYGMKYGRGVELLAAFATAFAFVVLIAGNMVAVALLFQIFVGVTFNQGAVLIAIIMLVYALGGGLIAITRIDPIQVSTVLAGGFLLMLFTWFEYGLTIPVAEGPLGYEQLTDPALGAWINWATIFSLGLGDVVALDFMERVFSAESPEVAEKGALGSAAGTVLVGIPFSLVAVSMPYILMDLGIEFGTEGVLYVMLGEASPVWVAAIVLAGIFAASLSTGTGGILATAAVFARNFIGMDVKSGLPVRDPPALSPKWTLDQEVLSEKYPVDLLLWATRIFFVAIAFFAVYIAISIPATGALLVLAFDIMLATTFVPLVFGLYWPRFANRPAAYGAIVFGGISRIIFFVLTPTVYGETHPWHIENEFFTIDHDGLVTIMAFVISIVAFLLLGYLTRNTHEPDYLWRDPWDEDYIKQLPEEDARLKKKRREERTG